MRLRRSLSGLLLLPLVLGTPVEVGARPERIRAGMSYYSDDFVQSGGIYDLGEEKNFEEVYQAYRYYEAIYDERERVVIFREYRRGARIRTEEYSYDDAGRLRQRVVTEAGQPPRVVPIDGPQGRP